MIRGSVERKVRSGERVPSQQNEMFLSACVSGSVGERSLLKGMAG